MTIKENSKKFNLAKIKPNPKKNKKEMVIGKTIMEKSNKIQENESEIIPNKEQSKKKKNKNKLKRNSGVNTTNAEKTSNINDNIEKTHILEKKEKIVKNIKQEDNTSATNNEVTNTTATNNEVTNTSATNNEVTPELKDSKKGIKIAKKQKKRKLLKENGDNINEINEVSEQTNLQKGIKKVKKLQKRKSVETISDNVEDKEENTEATKPKKRKLSETDIVDSDATESEETPKPKKTKAEKKEAKESEDPEVKARTIFVGNVPLKCTKKVLKKQFRKYGIIESLRIRGIPAANPKLTKKVAAIKQEFHPDRNNFICYIRYKSKEDALKAEAENGALFQGHHLRVHCCESKAKPDESKAIFIGNVNFDATEDELWKIFEICGPISHVRIIRDTFTGMGKGFGYINFKDNDAVQLALEMEDVKLRDRVLRITLCNSSVAKKNKKMNKKKEITKPGEPRFKKPFKKNRKPYNNNSPHGQEDTNNRKKGEFTPKGRNSFQGSKFTDKKKKFKRNKGLTEKKKKIDMIAPKTE